MAKDSPRATFEIKGYFTLDDGLTAAEASECLRDAIEKLREMGSAEGVVHYPAHTAEIGS